MTLPLRPLHPAIGAEVSGFQLAAPLDDPTLTGLQQAWMDHLLLLFRDQDLDDAQHIAFARRFGDLEIHPSKAHRSSRHPEIYRVSNVDEAGRILPPEGDAWKYLNLTWHWHSDSSFRDVPSTGSILRAVEVPKGGGDTLFANLYAAYDALPGEERARLEKLRVVHSHDYILSLSPGLARSENYTELPPVTHPLVRRHPVTGRRSLFISPHTMERVDGWSIDESRALFEQLAEHATEERFVYRHQWRAGDVLMWDNRCTMHAVMPYESTEVRRVMHRTTIVGSGPVLAA
jgi:alpha-ketoglutarate-dependent taurine dioxygenase